MTEWIVSRPPTQEDSNLLASNCIEVTYYNGVIGWEFATKLEW